LGHRFLPSRLLEEARSKFDLSSSLTEESSAMDLLRRWRLRRAAKQYARRLGPHLRRAYGAAEYYTAPQIRAAVPKLGLKSRYIVLGYAAFLSDEEFASRANEMPIYIAYDEARELVARFQPAGRFGASDYYESGIGMTGGLDGSSP
jgi:hypothetical protein